MGEAHARLTENLQPIGLGREVAARYIGVSPGKFDQMVEDGRMPKARRIDGRKVWDRRELDDAFFALPHDGDADDAANPWDEDYGGRAA